MPRIQIKIIALLSAVVAAVVLTTGFLAERGLRQREEVRLETSLRQRAELVQRLLQGRRIEVGSELDLSALAREAARASGTRVTLIDARGDSVADSSLEPGERPRSGALEARPEVGAALAGRVASDVRRSRTLGRSFLYLGIPAGPSREHGVVRLALDLGFVEAEVSELREELLAAAAMGLAVAVALSYVLSGLALRPVRELDRVARSVSEGDLDQRLAWRSNDEFGRIAEAIHGMADQLRRRLRDVTAEKEQLQAVLAGMVEGVLVIDRKERVVLANPRLRELLGVWGEVLGRPLWEVIRRPEVEAALGRVAEGREPVVLDLHLDDGDGRELQMHAVGFPASGDLLGTVAVFHDVTELRRLEGIRRDFVANVSHELRTPLTAIRGFAETLRNGEVTPEQRAAYLDVILRHADRLKALIEDVLDLSRIESRKLDVERVEVDLGRLAASVMRDMASQFESLRLETRLVQKGKAVAWTDRRAVEQILTNLLGNAAKYTEPGGRVEVRVIGGEGELRLEVADTGIGIPREDRPRIFERFYRVDKARSRDLGGTGLGLSIVKHLSQALGGDVYVESEVDRGTTFRVVLPHPTEA